MWSLTGLLFYFVGTRLREEGDQTQTAEVLLSSDEHLTVLITK